MLGAHGPAHFRRVAIWNQDWNAVAPAPRNGPGGFQRPALAAGKDRAPAPGLDPTSALRLDCPRAGNDDAARLRSGNTDPDPPQAPKFFCPQKGTRNRKLGRYRESPPIGAQQFSVESPNALSRFLWPTGLVLCLRFSRFIMSYPHLDRKTIGDPGCARTSGAWDSPCSRRSPGSPGGACSTLNSYGRRPTSGQQVKRRLGRSRTTYGAASNWVRMGYEVALAEPLPRFFIALPSQVPLAARPSVCPARGPLLATEAPTASSIAVTMCCILAAVSCASLACLRCRIRFPALWRGNRSTWAAPTVASSRADRRGPPRTDPASVAPAREGRPSRLGRPEFYACPPQSALTQIPNRCSLLRPPTGARPGTCLLRRPLRPVMAG